MKFADDIYTKAKNKRKVIRCVIQTIILLILLYLLVDALFTLKSYVPYQQQKTSFDGDKGFVALSYFGVARIGDQTLISEERLGEHLAAMKESGYVTVTREDIKDYYLHEKPLPAKSLFLIFEDGRRDTAIFAQKQLEKMNYKATILTYAEKFELKDNKFLRPDELTALEGNGFWEMGTNGYRLAFINVFDRYNNYLGELTPLEHSQVASYLGRKYNHYLMDYIRDENFVPKESYNLMQERISYDYEKLRDVYKKELGYVPQTYILMHSNTGAFGNNSEVSAVNEKWLTGLFDMNFNREGFAWNNRKSNIYDLTRMQPQSYWYANHVLMRVKYDQKMPVKFVEGDKNESKHWQVLKGEAEYKPEKIVLTTLPSDKCSMYLKDIPDLKDVELKVRLTGNKFGHQNIYLRTNEALTQGIKINLFGNYLTVYENNTHELLKVDLNKFDGILPVSVAEDKKNAELKELLTVARYSPNKEQAEIYVKRAQEKEKEKVASVADGAEEYVPDLNIRTMGRRDLEIDLKGSDLRLKIDGKALNETIKVSSFTKGKIGLEAVWGGYGWSQRNLADDVYDGVFEKILIADNSIEQPEPFFEIKVLGEEFKITGFNNNTDNVVYTNRLHGWAGFKNSIKQMWEKVLEFFITIF